MNATTTTARRIRFAALGTAGIACAAVMALALPLGSSAAPTTTAPAAKPAAVKAVAAPAAKAAANAAAPADKAAAPAVAHAVDNILVLQTGRIALPSHARIDRFAPLAGGGVVVSWFDTTSFDDHQQILDAKGGLVVDLGQGPWAVSPNGELVAHSPWEGPTNLYGPNGESAGGVNVHGAHLSLTNTDLYLDVVEATDDGVVVGTLEWDIATGSERQLPSGIASVSADGSRALQLWDPSPSEEPEPSPLCWATLDISGDTPVELHRACEGDGSWTIPTAISPDGEYVLAEESYDGDASGAIIHVFDAETGATAFPEAADIRAFSASWTNDGAIVLSRNTSDVTSAAIRPTSNSLQVCTVAGDCTTVGRDLKISPKTWSARYVVSE